MCPSRNNDQQNADLHRKKQPRCLGKDNGRKHCGSVPERRKRKSFGETRVEVLAGEKNGWPEAIRVRMAGLHLPQHHGGFGDAFLKHGFGHDGALSCDSMAADLGFSIRSNQ